MDIGAAVRAAKAGKRVAREGWNGKGMWLYYVPANSYAAQTEAARGEFGEMVPYRAYMAMKTAQGEVVPWLCSQSDLLDDDWVVVGEEASPFRYRKLAVEIEAFCWTGDQSQGPEPEWIVDAIRAGNVYFHNAGREDVSMVVLTLEGAMNARPGDWIIRGVKGEIYPCKPDIFAKTYEAA